MAMIRSTTVLTAALLNGGGPSVTKWLQPNHANVIAAMTASVMDSTEILRSLRNAIADNASSDLGGLTSSALQAPTSSPETSHPTIQSDHFFPVSMKGLHNRDAREPNRSDLIRSLKDTLAGVLPF
jgi:hypothetical protein